MTIVSVAIAYKIEISFKINFIIERRDLFYNECDSVYLPMGVCHVGHVILFEYLYFWCWCNLCKQYCHDPVLWILLMVMSVTRETSSYLLFDSRF